MPLVSIVIPAYNEEDDLARCLDSVRHQTFGDFEAIVVDDGSQDGTLALARAIAADDPRIKVVGLGENKGRHLARKAGVAHMQGEYVAFLDSDDELVGEDVLGRIVAGMEEQPCDIFRFGLQVCPEAGVDEDTARSFEAWSNAEADLHGAQIARAAFAESEGYQVPWHVTHRLFSAGLAKVAFAKMPDTRMQRAEDAYQYFVLASMAGHERSDCSIVGYLYHMGVGVTKASALAADRFLVEARQTAECVDAANAYADTFSSFDLHECALGLKHKLYETLCNNWHERVARADQAACMGELIPIIGGPEAGHELYRFLRDKAYDLLVHGLDPEGDQEYAFLRGLTSDLREATGKGGRDEVLRCTRMRMVAEDHARDAELVSRKKGYADQRVRIFVTAHRRAEVPPSGILQPVQVGPGNVCDRFAEMLHDDEGENISAKNASYCELTTQYWAWKNVSCDYVGFCHYRRYFNFSDQQNYKENPFGVVVDDYIDENAVKRYGLDDETIARCIEGYDIVTTSFCDLRTFPDAAQTPREQYAAAPYLHIADLERAVSIVKDIHPNYGQDCDAFLDGNKACFCNMYIMRKPLFDAYCEWLFPVLERWEAQTDTSLYSKEALRTPGHLSERLFNIYLLHQKRVEPGLKTKELQCVQFTNPDRRGRIEPIPPASSLPVIPVAFAADDAYVPMLTTTAFSMMRNASPRFFYDIVVLQRGITGTHQEEMRGFFAQFPNCRLSFVDVEPVVASYELTTNNPHIGVETYYRFLVQDLLPYYDKVLYLDSDLIVKGDVSELFATELGDNLLAATHDIDYLGNLNMNDGWRIKYTRETMGMKDPYRYFQAGVLVLNTAAMRQAHAIGEWLEFAVNPALIFNDQDVLNIHCEGRVVYLDDRWNITTDTFDRYSRIYSFAPAQIQEGFFRGRADAQIVHYAGADKPWNQTGCDLEELYWSYARQTPFYELLLGKLAASMASRAAKSVSDRIDEASRAIWENMPLIHEKAVEENSSLRKVFDPILPQGTNRREAAKALVRALRGRK